MKDYFDEEFIKILDKFPDLPTYEQHLNELENLDLSNFTQDQIHTTFFDRAILLPNQGISIPNNESNNRFVYRVRLNINEDKEDLNLIRTFSYPDPSFCKENGRANLRYKSVFYCADIPLTAFLESRPKNNDIGFMGKWQLKCHRDLTYIAFFPSDLSKKNYWYQTAIKAQQNMILEIKKIKSNKNHQLEYLFNFISKLYADEQPPYSISSWIANKMLYDYYGIDFLVYPSFRLNSDSCNLAFHPNFIDKFFQLVSVIKFRITDFKDNSATYDVISIGKPNLTNIEWNLPEDGDIYTFN
jgi:hypothetical protein